jgi:hypothetical protein
MPASRLTDLSDKVLIALSLLGEMTVADRGVIDELVSLGLADAAGSKLVITEVGRGFVKQRTAGR